MTKKSEIKSLKKKREFVKTQVTLFEKFVNTINASADIPEQSVAELIARKEKIVPMLDLFINYTMEFITLQDNDDDVSEQYEEELQTFQDKYYMLMVQANLLIKKNQQVNNSQNDNQSNESTSQSNTNKKQSNTILPTITLPTFEGNFIKWREFKDKFLSMIGNNNELSNTQKLAYLKSALKGEPAELLASLETTDSNYSIAWTRLEKRYDNKRRIINNHIVALLHLPSMSRESSSALRQLTTAVQNHIDCLKTFELPVDKWDALLIPILIEKLDSSTIKEWESKLNRNYNSTQIPTLAEFLDFLNVKQNTLETINSRCKSIEPSKQTNSKTNWRETKSFNINTQSNITCAHCELSHLISNCENFLQLSEYDRNKRTRELKLCLNCLKKGHFSQDCKSKYKCKICRKSHHTLLHISNCSSKTVTQSNKNTSEVESSGNDVVGYVAEMEQFSNVFLSTARVIAIGNQSKEHEVRILLDSGSQSNFITSRTCKLLNLKLESVNLNVRGINLVKSQITQKTTLQIKSRVNEFTATISCLVVPEISDQLPSQCVAIHNLTIPTNIKIADPTFNTSGPIDILIGANLFYDLLCVGQIKDKNGPTWHKTKFGWIISGAINQLNKKPITSCSSHFTLTDLHQQVERFWNAEEIQSDQRWLSTEEKYCEFYYENTTTRNSMGRFVVKIPLRNNIDQLGSSHNEAKTRLLSLERRLTNNSSLQIEYNKFMKEYIDLHHMSKIEEVPKDSFFLPHHPVINQNSSTTKVRVVFDGSCSIESGLPINEVQCVGPTLQQELVEIIARFRTHQYVITADITKMYRQVLIHPNDRKYQLILWRFNPDEEITCYKLNTVTYGTAAAPYLAIKTLNKLAQQNTDVYPLEASIIQRDFYVDDLLTGANSINEILDIKNNLNQILNSGGFSLSKWVNNFENTNDNQNSNKLKVNETIHKTLGIMWNPNTDTFSYSTAKIKQSSKMSKRTILGMIAQLFDPLGLLAPATIVAKLLLQDIWKSKIGWDESLPLELQTQWLAFYDNIKYLEKLTIPRHVLLRNSTFIEIHAFSDASIKAYRSCLYIRSINDNGEYKTCLLTAKSRVAPIKPTTIPRLELNGAVLSAKLVNKFKQILNLRIARIYYWSDSQIVICWIKSNAHRFSIYVANRITEIQTITNTKDWHYVRSEENPADLISRGVLPNRLKNLSMWWNGPQFLETKIDEDDNNENYIINSQEDMEFNKKYIALPSTVCEDVLKINKFSSFTRLIRTTAYVLRFINNCRNNHKNTETLTTHELSNSLNTIVKFVQNNVFSVEIKALSSAQPIHSKSQLVSLSPFLDNDGILRVGGRIRHSNFSFEKKHPMILPKSNHFTKIIFQHYHETSYHPGPNLLLSIVRENFWPIHGKNLSKQIVRTCVKCTRFKAETIQQQMGDLPSRRITATLPFFHVGLDYGGPFWIKDRNGRGCKKSKCYLCLFVCCATKAIHLELVSDLTTNAFMAALRRFISRRGKPITISSDNGTTFVGANKEINNLINFLKNNQDEIQEKASITGIQWIFIPPYSPNFGGLWEAGIKSVKYHLKRVMGETILTYEELSTLLYQIEAVLNSRPIIPLSSQPDDVQILTPAHFLIGKTFNELPEVDVKQVPTTRLNRYQHLQQIKQHFWTQWSRSYISELQQRQKWKQSTTNDLNINDIVLLKNENTSPSCWPLGKITEIHPGKDMLTRVVSVKFKGGIVKRSISKLVKLPV